MKIRHYQLPALPASLRYWHGGNIYKTHFYNSFSIMLPHGEKYFIDAVKDNARQIKGHALQAELQSFIAQEASHRRLHNAYNDRLRQQGYPVDKLEQQVERWLDKSYRKHSSLTRLAYVVANEHFTYVFARALLQNHHWLDGAHPQFASLWRWHALEELEHRAVAFKLYQAVGGGYWRRALMMTMLTPILFFEVLYNSCSFLRQDKRLWRPGLWLKSIGYFWIYPGILLRTLPAFLRFFSPRFNPAKQDCTELLVKHQQAFEAYVRKSD